MSNSDAATVLLEGRSMASGNLALSGWSLSRDSFWTIDALGYLLTTLLAGVRPVLLDVVPSAFAAIAVLLGCLLSAGGRRHRVASVAATATVLILLALPARPLVPYLVQSGVHVGTALWCLAAFASLRSGRLGGNWLLAVVLLAAALLGDLQAGAFGLAPVAGGGVVAVVRRRDWLAGFPNLSAAAVSVVLALFGREIADRAGTFAVNAGNPTAPVGQMLTTNLHDLADIGLEMLGVRSGPLGPLGMPEGLAIVHVVGVLAILAGCAVALGGLLRGVFDGVSGWHGPLAPGESGPAEPAGDTTGTDHATRSAASPPDAGTRSEEPWRLDDMLLLAVLADVLVFLRLDEPAGVATYARYLTAGLIFASVLAGRLVGRLTDRLADAPPRVRRATGAAGLALLGAFAAGFAFANDRATPLRPASRLASFLTAHHLERGLADYWTASITTVESSDAALVRPVIDGPAGTVVRYDRNSDVSWYAGQRFQFLAYDTALPLVTSATAAATFGAPARSYIVAPYRILVWKRPISVPLAGAAS